MTIENGLNVKEVFRAQPVYTLPMVPISSYVGFCDQSLPVSPSLPTSPGGGGCYMYEEVVPTTQVKITPISCSPGVDISLLSEAEESEYLPTDGDNAWQSPDEAVKAEDVMMSSDVHLLPTLAQLNDCENLVGDNILDDITSVIFQDLQGCDTNLYSTESPVWSSGILGPGLGSPKPSEGDCACSDTMHTLPRYQPNGTVCTPTLQKLLSDPVGIGIKQEVIQDSLSHSDTVEPMLSSAGMNCEPSTSKRPMSANSTERKWLSIKKFLETPSAEEEEEEEEDVPVCKKAKLQLQHDDDVSADEQDYYDDYNDSSDDDNNLTDDDGSVSSFVEEMLADAKKEKHYFWQYNTQSKGPKGKRLVKGMDSTDPHVLNTFEDPVFDPDLQDVRYKHGGRARRGDGNDITPNPYKLFQIGNQLRKLNNRIYEITHQPRNSQGTKGKSRREKNKYASRACRLKKKAQHEANKVKLFGLDKEHGELMSVLGGIKTMIQKHLELDPAIREELSPKLDNLIQANLTEMIAGNAADYVNAVLEKVALGDRSGGIAPFKYR